MSMSKDGGRRYRALVEELDSRVKPTDWFFWYAEATDGQTYGWRTRIQELPHLRASDIDRMIADHICRTLEGLDDGVGFTHIKIGNGSMDEYRFIRGTLSNLPAVREPEPE